jgi:hypothetical protein
MKTATKEGGFKTKACNDQLSSKQSESISEIKSNEEKSRLHDNEPSPVMINP